MRKFAAAKQSAQVFLDSVPDDLYVGIVTFAGKVSTLQKPSLDRAASHDLIDGLTLSYGTALYPGVQQAVAATGSAGPRSVVVLSDGRDTSRTPLSAVTTAIDKAGVKVDVIALAQSAKDEALLSPLSKAGGGRVITAADPAALAEVFTTEAQALASQVLITAPLPEGASREGTLSVSVDVGSDSFTDAAFVTLTEATPAKPATDPAQTLSAAPAGIQLSSTVMLAGVGALGVGLLVLVVAIMGGLGRTEPSIESRIEAYTSRGAAAAARGKNAQQAPTMTAQAINVAQKALSGNENLEARLGGKLEAAGLAFKPAEWLLLHAGVAVGFTLMVFLLTGADPLLSVLALAGGILLPWVYLGRKQSRRLKAFNSQLAGTLQLLAGSLQAGLSLAQGMDTIVREGAEPMAGEFRRGLVETRLGVPIEDALESIGERMMSDDFKWTVMAIRIQREVGGNLAELMLNVAATLRERDYLRRQVKSLSAEGRFSAYVLLALPPGVLVYEFTVNRSYLDPLITTAFGFVLLGAMGALMGIGAFMMSRMIKLEV